MHALEALQELVWLRHNARNGRVMVLSAQRRSLLLTSHQVHQRTWRWRDGLTFLYRQLLTTVTFQNTWLWTADHQLDNDQFGTQLDIFSGRGILVEGTDIWFYGTGSEHHVIYQYRFYNAQNVFAGLIQTETPYYQPAPCQYCPRFIHRYQTLTKLI